MDITEELSVPLQEEAQSKPMAISQTNLLHTLQVTHNPKQAQERELH